MIKLPYGKPVYQRLYTRFTVFSELMVFLEQEAFTGYLEIESWEGSGKIILKEGSITHVVIKTIEGVFDRNVALNKIYNQVKHPECTIDVYELPEVFTDLVKDFCHAELMYYRLDSRFTDVKKLLENLTMQKHYGLMEVEFEKPRQTGIIYLQKGEVIKTQMVTDTPKKTYARDFPLKRLLKLAGEKNGIVNVYRVKPGNDIEIVKPGKMKGTEKPVKALDMNDSRLQMLKLTVSEVGELFSKLELILKKVKKDFDFNYHLRRLRLDLTAKYPFLDPFAGEIEYADGTMNLTVAPGKDENFEEGIRELTQRMIDLVSPLISEGVMNQTLNSHRELLRKLED